MIQQVASSLEFMWFPFSSVFTGLKYYMLLSLKSSFGLIFIESLSMQAAILQKLYSCHEICHFTSLLHLQSVPHAVGRKLSQFGQNLRLNLKCKGFSLDSNEAQSNHLSCSSFFLCQNLLLDFLLLVPRKFRMRLNCIRA